MVRSAGPSLLVVIIDDSPSSLQLISTALKQPDLEIITATDPQEGLAIIFNRRPQIVLTDLVMPDIDGMEVLDRVIDFDPSIEVIIMTGHYSTESAVQAIRRGASDYLEKPIRIDPLRERVGRSIEEAHRKRRAMQLEGELLATSEFEGMVGNSLAMCEMLPQIRRVAPHFRTVLITGETGTGKDLVARALHRLSPASAGRLVVLNCSSVVESMFETALFGYAQGAFPGATSDKAGLVELAHNGVLLLDEVGDMPLTAQAKLLRVLQSQEVQRIGSLTTEKVDVRVVAATNHNLRQAVAAKQFREDLFYRLAMVEIRVPPLAGRKEDLPLLERRFVARYAAEFKKQIRGLTHRAQLRLYSHNWPGNVRELENVISHACMMTQREMIEIDDLPAYIRTGSGGERPNAPEPMIEPASLAEQERNMLVRALEATGGNQSEAARILGIGRDAIRYKLKKHGLDAGRAASSEN